MRNKLGHWLAWMLAFIGCSQSIPIRAAETPTSNDLAGILGWLSDPATEPDLLATKLAIDHLIDASSNVDDTRALVAKLASDFRRIVPSTWPVRAQVDSLLAYIYKPGPWNEHMPFGYDFQNPEPGRSIPNQLLSNYLADRAGNCVSMPMLFAVLGQHIGLKMTLALAPAHVLVKVQDEAGAWFNVEATGGGYKADSSYQRDTHITDLAMETGIYLQPLSKRESAAVTLASLMEFYRDRPELVEEIASIALRLHPKFVEAMLHIGGASHRQRQARFGVYELTGEIPEADRAEYLRLSLANLAWFRRAEDLGWVEPTTEQWNRYLETLKREKELLR